MGTRPYLCPVCKGKTIVKKGFYPDDLERTSCKACHNGVVFGTTVDNEYSYPIYQQYPQYPATSFTPLTKCNLCGAYYTGGHTCWTIGYTGDTK